MKFHLNGKALLAAILAGMMIFSMAGCSNKSGKGKPDEDKTGSSVTETGGVNTAIGEESGGTGESESSEGSRRPDSDPSSEPSEIDAQGGSEQNGDDVQTSIGDSAVAESQGGTSQDGENSNLAEEQGSSAVIMDGNGEVVHPEDLPQANMIGDGSARVAGGAEMTEPDLSGFELYYGTVTKVTPDGFEVAGYAHRNFGNEVIRFLISDTTEYIGEAKKFSDLDIGDFVKVHHDPKMTRSIPPQCFVARVEKAPQDMYVMDCEVIEAPEKVGDAYHLLVATLDDARNQSILTYSADTDTYVVGDILVGAKLSVLTKGIATMSLPPQVPAEQIAEYRE